MRRAAAVSLATLAALVAGFGACFVRPDLPLATVRARYAPSPPSRTVRVAGMDVHYRDEGPPGAPAVVLLHGMNGSLHTWDAWTAALADSLRVVRLDLPGYGVTGPAPDDDYRVAAYVRTLDTFLDAVGVRRAALAGHSFGGEIAWRYALARPDRVERLILVDPSGYWAGRAPDGAARDGAPPGGARALAWPGVRHVLALVGPRWLFASSLRQAYGVPARVTPALVDRYWDLARRPGNREALLRRSATADPFPFDALRGVRAPALLMWGGRDRWVPPAAAEQFRARLAGAELRVYPDAGHVPMEEVPAPTAADARRFLLGSVRRR